MLVTPLDEVGRKVQAEARGSKPLVFSGLCR